MTVATGSRTAWSRSVDFVGADPLGVAVAEGIVGERAGSALGVVDHRDLEQRAVGHDTLGDLADVGDIVDHLRGDTPADVAHDDRVAQTEAEEVRGVGARITAGDDEQAHAGEHDGALVRGGRSEGAVALKRRVEGGSVRTIRGAQLKPGRATDAGAGRRMGGWLLGHEFALLGREDRDPQAAGGPGVTVMRESQLMLPFASGPPIR